MHFDGQQHSGALWLYKTLSTCCFFIAIYCLLSYTEEWFFKGKILETIFLYVSDSNLIFLIGGQLHGQRQVELHISELARCTRSSTRQNRILSPSATYTSSSPTKCFSIHFFPSLNHTFTATCTLAYTCFIVIPFVSRDTEKQLHVIPKVNREQPLTSSISTPSLLGKKFMGGHSQQLLSVLELSLS